MKREPVTVLVVSAAHGWTVVVLAPPLFGDASKCAARLRAEGATARAKAGQVIVDADAGVRGG